MRQDMNHVLVERPRIGHKNKYHDVRQRYDYRSGDEDDYDMPRRGMRSVYGDRHGSYRKSLNENLQPLRRFLWSQVGRPWDKVYSEIAAHVNRNNAVQLHIMQHLKWEVETDPRVIEETKGYYKNRTRRGRTSLYVDPKDGILKAYRCRKAQPESKAARTSATPDVYLHPTQENVQYRKIEGRWHEVRYAWYERKRPYMDVLLNRMWLAGDADTFLDQQRMELKNVVVTHPDGTMYLEDQVRSVYLVPVKKFVLSQKKVKALKLP
jgi:hypothetical protein